MHYFSYLHTFSWTPYLQKGGWTLTTARAQMSHISGHEHLHGRSKCLHTATLYFISFLLVQDTGGRIHFQTCRPVIKCNLFKLLMCVYVWTINLWKQLRICDRTTPLKPSRAEGLKDYPKKCISELYSKRAGTSSTTVHSEFPSHRWKKKVTI